MMKKKMAERRRMEKEDDENGVGEGKKTRVKTKFHNLSYNLTFLGINVTTT